MLEIIILLLLGLTVAAVWDLKTTEVPDELPYLLIIVGIFYWFVISSANNDFTYLFYSLVIGTLLLFFGLLMYRTGKWGGADAWLLAAVGYMLPLYNNGIFMISFVPNFLIVASAYTILYSFAIGMMHKESFSYLKEDLRKNYRVFLIPAAFLFFPVYVYLQGDFLLISFIPFFLILFLVVFWRYALVIEKKVFTRKVPASKIKEGDVLEDMVWRGLTPEEVRKIKQKRKSVTIKEGIRFVPVFPITVLVTLVYGNILLMFL
jgi:Flp pilus assembly protein protease CpaA